MWAATDSAAGSCSFSGCWSCNTACAPLPCCCRGESIELPPSLVPMEVARWGAGCIPASPALLMLCVVMPLLLASPLATCPCNTTDVCCVWCCCCGYCMMWCACMNCWLNRARPCTSPAAAVAAGLCSMPPNVLLAHGELVPAQLLVPAHGEAGGAVTGSRCGANEFGRYLR